MIQFCFSSHDVQTNKNNEVTINVETASSIFILQFLFTLFIYLTTRRDLFEITA